VIGVSAPRQSRRATFSGRKHTTVLDLPLVARRWVGGTIPAPTTQPGVSPRPPRMLGWRTPVPSERPGCLACWIEDEGPFVVEVLEQQPARLGVAAVAGGNQVGEVVRTVAAHRTDVVDGVGRLAAIPTDAPVPCEDGLPDAFGKPSPLLLGHRNIVNPQVKDVCQENPYTVIQFVGETLTRQEDRWATRSRSRVHPGRSTQVYPFATLAHWEDDSVHRVKPMTDGRMHVPIRTIGNDNDNSLGVTMGRWRGCAHGLRPGQGKRERDGQDRAANTHAATRTSQR
jgi:hypothetical protein